MQLAKYSVLRVCKFLFIGLHWNHWLVFIFMQVLVYLWFCWNVFVTLLECFFNIFFVFEYLCLGICENVSVFVFVYLWSCVSICVCLSVIVFEYLCLWLILWRECGGRWGARGQALSTPPVAIRPDGHFGPMLSPAGLPYNPVNTNTYTQAQILKQVLSTPPVAILVVTSHQCYPKPATHITPYDHDGDDGDDDDEDLV